MSNELTQIGQPDGPKPGRPKGSKNRITLLKQALELQLREAARPRMGEVLDKAINMALDGDRTMIKLLLELHMAKGTPESEKAQDKAEITINVQGAPALVSNPPLSAEYEDVTDVAER